MNKNLKQNQPAAGAPLPLVTIEAEAPPCPVMKAEPPSPLALIQFALDKNADIEKLERLIALQDRMVARDAEGLFNAAMSRVQAKCSVVARDASNPQTRSKYATYAALDRVLRPIYTEEGFALSFDQGDAPSPETVRVLCYVTHSSGHTRTYRADVPADGKGAKGNDVMTKTHATGSAFSYGRRYLAMLIFNLSTADDDGNGTLTHEVEEGVQEIEEARTREELLQVYSRLHDWAIAQKNMPALTRFTSAKDARKRELGGAR